MNLEPSPEELAFRDEVRAFIADNLTLELKQAGERQTSLFCDPEYSLPWQRILHARGWAAPNWPVEYGGPDWTDVQRHIFAAECTLANAPRLASQGLRMVAPCIMKYGTPEQKAFYLRRILSGEDYWCQGYSEPGSGSDLASLQMRADRDGDHYVLNGSKIWTTHAHWSNRMFCLVRTRFEGKPQAGITFLLLDMDTPGLEVKPIITLAGDHETNQVFFSDVRVPVSGRLGEENDGWTVAKYLLEFERGGGDWAATLRAYLATLHTIVREAPADTGASMLDDTALRARFASVQITVEAIEITENRITSELVAGRTPGPASSMLKVLGTEALQAIDELGLEAMGSAAAVDQKAWSAPGANAAPIGPPAGVVAIARYLNNRAASIYGGSNQIQRDIMSKLVLGL